MQVNETLSAGLKRELTVTIPASDLTTKLSSRLDDLKQRVRINGFRPGKVPVSHLKRVYGKAAMAEIVEAAVGEGSRQVLAERGERAAMQPKIEMTEDAAEANRILDGRADLVFTIEYEVLPDFEVADYKGLKIERPIAEVSDDEIAERLKRIADSNRSYAPVDRAAQDGDRVALAYVGKLDGTPFEGGSDQNTSIVIGSGQFVPGFEDGLKGLKAGDEKVVEVTFPEDYAAKHLAGKPVAFDVVVNEVGGPAEAELDDAFANRLGIESFDRLREVIKGQVENEYGFATRQRVKRQMLDQLDKLHDFPLPANLVDQEFENIWRQVMHDVEHHGKTFEDEGTTEEKARKDYRAIAERRVRLGLVLSKIGEQAEVEVLEEELQRALYAQVRRYPGQEKVVFEHYKKNPEALQMLRAPIFEEKVIDYILELSDVTDKPVSKEELLAEDEDDHDLDFEHHHHEDQDRDAHHHEH